MSEHDPPAPSSAGSPAPVPGPGPAPVPMAVPEAVPAGGPDTSTGGAAAPVEPPARRRSRLRTWLWVVIPLLLLSAAVSSRIDLQYYAVQPGSAQPVQQFITVPPGRATPVAHPVLLTDVQLARVTALSYLFFKAQADTELYPLPAVTGGTDPGELNAQGDLQMSQAIASAKTAALRHLGYTVPATPAGAVIAGTFPGSPANGVLHVGDVVVALDGTPTLTARALTDALAPHTPGQTVTFSVRKGGKGTPVPVRLTLERTTVEVGGQRLTLDVGIQPEDQVDYTYPFPVKISVPDIGGPSAGLALTLGVIDALDGGSLTGGKTVAATGTMDAQGDVGDVGGVPQKTVAVGKAGATIFLVPDVERGAAQSKARPGLHVYAVRTLDDAIRVLEANGGRLGGVHPAAAPSSSAAAPSAPAG